MPAKVIWAPSALSDLEAIVTYIAADNPPAAVRAGEAILAVGDRLALLPRIGQVLSDAELAGMREVVCGNYRVIHELLQNETVVSIVRIWHGARGAPVRPSS
jgi:plasmid stabilization system protein ParE